MTGADLDAAQVQCGIRVDPGDALVVRGGWTVHRDAGEPVPGMSLDAVAWMHEHDISVYLGDIGDARPPLSQRMPILLHQVGIARLGMPLVDGAEVGELSAACAELGRYSFLLSIAPPRILGATGMPVNPQAIF